MAEIRISTRTVRIGHQVYSLGNISDVRTVPVGYAGRLATYYPVREIVVLAMAATAVAAILDGPAAVVLVALAVARVVYLAGVLAHRRLVRREWYTLVIETGGTRYPVLSSTDPVQLDVFAGLIVRAVGDPPSTERVVRSRAEMVVGRPAGHQVTAGRQIAQSRPWSRP
ncbi:MAG TPA: DUF6232 family protein [Actinophytocola sp.]|jgi:hypothetical protein|nr:DUF6232 family protein [Actinophytocola sp.]